MKQIIKWFVAVLVTVAAFSAATWASGVVLSLVHALDPDVRWGISGSVGVAVAALAALWGYGFASGEREAAAADHPQDVLNQISGDIKGGQVIQARDIAGPVSFGSPGPRPPPDTDDES